MTITTQNQIPQDWFASYYSSEYADSVKSSLTPDRTKREIDFILSTTNLPPQSHIADLGCGHARHTLQLAAHNHYLTAIDLNPNFINQAKQSAKASNLQIDFHIADMRTTIPPSKPYNLILSLFNSFGFFTDSQNQSLIIDWTKHLSKGGYWLIDIWNRDALIRNFQPSRAHQPNSNLTVTEEATLDTLAGRINRQYTYNYSDGRTATYQTSFRIYTPSEIKTILEAANLTIIKTFGNLTDQPYTLDSPRLVVLAQK
ncbi:class I SAM-dependent methyltransferase [Planctomycetota bacterium]|nr:class I SAM-dependent methyltransferase [Planctomycetota bacterium]